MLMGTRLQMDIRSSDRAGGMRAIEQTLTGLRDVEAVISSWDSSSLMGRLNSAVPHVASRTPSPLLDVLVETRDWVDRTNGAFDPGIGALIDVWDLRGEGRSPTVGELTRAVGVSGLAKFEVDRAARTVVRPSAETWLDAGAFGKGLGLRRMDAVLLLAGVRHYRINFGGQVLLRTESTARRPFRIGVAHPQHRDSVVVTLSIYNGSVATSSQSERFVTVDGEHKGHVIDPRTGYPVPAWGSVTVVADDPMVADILATALLVLGPERGREWLIQHRDVAALLLEVAGPTLRAYWSPAMSRYMRRLSAEKVNLQ